MRGRFITLEGGEGVGKSTLQAALVRHLEAEGLNVIATREPGGTPLAEKVRELVLFPGDDPWTPLGQALLMNAARADHLEKKIRPALERGAWVVCDRFADSTLVYQGRAADRTERFEATLRALEREVLGGTQPDLTLVLDADPALVLERRSARTAAPDAFEARDLKFHAAVREGFLSIARDAPKRCAVINATQSADAVVAEALEVIQARLGAPSGGET